MRKINRSNILILIALFFVVIQSAAETNEESPITLLCRDLVVELPDSVQGARVVIVPFSDNTGAVNRYGRGVAEMVMVRLQKMKLFQLVDRTEFKKVVEEIELSNTDFVDPATALRIGEILTAEYIVTGGIQPSIGSFEITAKLIHVASTQLISASSASVQQGILDDMMKDLLGERNQVSSTLFRSLVAPGWGQFYAAKPVRGMVSLVLCAGAGTYFGVTSFKAVDSRQDVRDQAKRLETIANQYDLGAPNADSSVYIAAKATYEEMHKKQNKAFSKAYLAGAILGAAWAVNLTDAFIAGMQMKKRVQPYFAIDGNGVPGICVVVQF